MTIQLPVLLWTVISFIVFMILLDRILFRPIHDVMDKRAMHVIGAKADHAARQAAYDAKVSALQNAGSEYLRKQKEKEDAEARRITEEARTKIDAAREGKRNALEDCRKALEAEQNFLQDALHGNTARLADLALKSVTK